MEEILYFYSCVTVFLLFFQTEKTTVNKPKASGIFTVFCCRFCCKSTELLQLHFCIMKQERNCKKRKHSIPYSFLWRARRDKNTSFKIQDLFEKIVLINVRKLDFSKKKYYSFRKIELPLNYNTYSRTILVLKKYINRGLRKSRAQY